MVFLNIETLVKFASCVTITLCKNNAYVRILSSLPIVNCCFCELCSFSFVTASAMNSTLNWKRNINCFRVQQLKINAVLWSEVVHCNTTSCWRKVHQTTNLPCPVFVWSDKEESKQWKLWKSDSTHFHTWT